jgi:ankyrin repeat protein
MWIDKNSSALLWMSGMPGMGKSVLARSFVEDAMANSDDISIGKDAVVAHFFCNYVEAAFNNEETVLRSILHQFLQSVPLIFRLLQSRLQIRSARGLAYTLDRRSLWQALEEVLALEAFKTALIVIDAIEELPKAVGIELLRGLYATVVALNAKSPNHGVKIFITSRHSSEYASVLLGIPALRLQRSHIEQGIRRYVGDLVLDFAKENTQFANAVSDSTLNEISEKIAVNADGMFLWAEVAWQSFRRGLFWNADIVNERLRNLSETPPGLNPLYDRMLENVEDSIKEDMWSIFSIMATVSRPLEPKALGILLAMNRSTQTPKSTKDIVPFGNIEEIVQNYFPNLIRLEDDGSIKFIHLSFKEYLDNYWKMRNPDGLTKYQRIVARSCLQYVTLNDVVSRAISGDLRGPSTLCLFPFLRLLTSWLLEIAEEFPFFEYSSKYFIYHLSGLSHDDDLWLGFARMGCTQSIFGRKARPFIEAILLSKFYGGSMAVHLSSPLIHIVRDIQSEDLVRRFISAGYDIDDKWRTNKILVWPRGIDGSSALYFCCDWATTGMRLAGLGLLLLELGASPNVADDLTCLQCVLRSDVPALYDKILAHPQIDLDLRDSTGSTIVHHLVKGSHISRLSYLLNNKDCNVNAQDATGFTPLHIATLCRNLDAMKVLLDDHRIRLDITDKQGRTPLTVATYWGYRDAALLFIQSTTLFPTPKDGEFSPLTMAAKHCQKDVVLKLLNKYSNLNPHIDQSGKGILHHCAINEWPEVLELCLSKEWADPVNINQIDQPGATALHYAASLGNVGSIKVLLRHGASIRFQDRNGRTAAIAAADSGFKDALSLLVEAPEIDAGQKDNLGRNLVHWSATCDWVDLFEKVLHLPNANIASKDKYGKQPLEIAGICGCWDTVHYIRREMIRQGVATQRMKDLEFEAIRNGETPGWFEDWKTWQDARRRKKAEEVVEEVVVEDDYYKIEDAPLLNRVFKTKAYNDEWQRVASIYPASKWALVCMPILNKEKGDSEKPRERRRNKATRKK